MISVVTAITNGKDRLLPQPLYAGVEYIAFVDDSIDVVAPWQIRPAYTKFHDPVMNAKIHKVLTHKYVTTPYIVWMDGNRSLKRNPHELVELMGEADFAMFEHYGRRCIYQEIKVCLQVKKGDPTELSYQRQHYEDNGVPRNMGLYECAAFIRKNNEYANTMFERWWAEICRFSNRDQVSFPVVFRDQPFVTIPGKLFWKGGESNEYFTYTKHVR